MKYIIIVLGLVVLIAFGVVVYYLASRKPKPNLTLDELNREIEKARSDSSLLTLSLAELEAELDACTRAAAKLEADIDTGIETLDDIAAQYETTLNAWALSQNNYFNLITDFTNSLSPATIQKLTKDYGMDINDTQAQILIDCQQSDTCYMPALDSLLLKQVKSIKTALQAYITDLIREIDTLKLQIEQILERIKNAETTKAVLEDQIREAEIEKAELETEINTIKAMGLDLTSIMNEITPTLAQIGPKP